MFDFAEKTSDMTAIEILNYYRNLYYAEPQITERGIIANAINEIFNLINRQKEEIKAFENGRIFTRDTMKKALDDVDESKQRNIDSFRTSEKDFEHVSVEIKAEAYKEFAERIKEEIENAYNNNSNVLHEHMSKHAECPDYEFIAIVRGKMTALQGLDDFIDNLLKEMVGEK